MGLEKVKEEILEKARKDASEVVDAAKAEAKAIIRNAEKQMQDYQKLVEEEEERTADLMKRREVASAELELQKKLLSAKNELIEGVFGQAGKKLRLRNDKSREADVKALLKAASGEMDVAAVQCNSRDSRFLEGSALKVVKSDSMLGGIIAESPDGKLRVDYSYETLLGQARVKVLGDVARKLFGK
ncbi:hypothetical protein HYU20_02770 [Candidatus Woesearchaeota archaeon]|nr:hypothetical protein [Candidatus Woesearchaeota archaeon]